MTDEPTEPAGRRSSSRSPSGRWRTAVTVSPVMRVRCSSSGMCSRTSVVQVRVTEEGPKGRYLRAEVVQIVEPSPFRVDPPCPFAGSCGGCDFQHVAVDEQRRLKAQVVREQLTRLGKVDWSDVDWSGEVQAVPDVDPDLAGLRWRTRVRFAVDAAGRAGLVRHRSHEVVPIDDCVIAHPLVDVEEITTTQWPGVQEVSVTVSPETDERSVQVGPAQGRESLERRAAGRSWQVSSGGFWQVHPQAADALVGAVMDLAEPQAGEHLVDLYSGVGLFAGVWGSRTGGRVDAVEGHRAAAADAEVNLADLPLAQVHSIAVERFVVTQTQLTPRCRGPGPAASGGQARRGSAGSCLASACGRLRRLRPGCPRKGRGVLRRVRLPAHRRSEPSTCFR